MVSYQIKKRKKGRGEASQVIKKKRSFPPQTRIHAFFFIFD
jgi:hypothetical protein